MRKSVCITLFGLLFATGAQAGEAEMDRQARQGVVRCGGSNFLRLNGTEVQFTNYNLRNLSSTTPITVERLVFWDANGVVLFDTNLSPFPAFNNGVLGPSNQVLGPNQTADLDTTDVLDFLPQNQRPIQLEVTWSAPAKVLTLDVALVRVGRQRDPATGNQLAERSRHVRDCRTISAR